MKVPHHILHLEDDPTDAATVLSILVAADIKCPVTRVDNRSDFVAALERGGIDLVLSDFTLPAFDGLSALEIVKDRWPDIPVIVVSGALGEERAIDTLKRGATDYVLKERLSRLVPAVRRALEQVDDRAKLRAAEARVREQADFLNKARDAIVVRDLEGRILYWNFGAERTFGWTALEAVGRTEKELFGASALAGSDCLRDALLADGWRGEVSVCDKAGRALILESRVTVVRDAAGQPQSHLIISTDITEHAKLKEQVGRAQRLEAIGNLANGIAHDLNNILAPMLMAAGLLKGKLTEPRDRDIMGMVESSAKRGASIISQLLTFSRGVEGARINVQSRHLLSEMDNIMRETFPRNLNICADFPSDLWIVVADATQLHQVLMNLCINARDAMPEGGRLTLAAQNVRLDQAGATLCSLKRPGPYLVFSVSDTGHGIPPAVVSRIFEPFFTTKVLGKGTGLGLSTVLGIAKSHGGSVTVDTRPGQGTVFKVYLPATGATVEVADEAGGEMMPHGHGELILVVDDEAPILATTGRFLQDHGYRAIMTRNSEEAIRQFVEHSGGVHLVVTDVMMPGMGGVELVRTLRILEPEIKIIAISGLGEENKRGEFVAMGVREMLTKPCPPAVLLATINKLLRAKA
jgi:PAS domain S-box-containing protein